MFVSCGFFVLLIIAVLTWASNSSYEIVVSIHIQCYMPNKIETDAGFAKGVDHRESGAQVYKEVWGVSSTVV